MSESTIYRIFSGQLGLHLNEYITTTRLNAACRYLSETDRKVADIAFACGFTGLSNFYRVFQAHLGISPKEYRHSHLPLGSPVEPERIRYYEAQPLRKFLRTSLFRGYFFSLIWLRLPVLSPVLCRCLSIIFPEKAVELRPVTKTKLLIISATVASVVSNSVHAFSKVNCTLYHRVSNPVYFPTILL